MKTKWFLTIVILILSGCIAGANDKDFVLSGTLKDGLRVVTLDSKNKGEILHFYRGDYVRFLLTGNAEARLSIPEMDVDITVPMEDPGKPYIKFKVTGTFAYSLDNQDGEIIVHEYIQPDYEAVTSKRAQIILRDKNPLILDVRTKGEYNRGHLRDAVLIPVQELQRRLDELEEYKTKPIFIYCATGNRSTVASKILLDNGFKEIYNLRHGISGWVRDGYKVVK